MLVITIVMINKNNVHVYAECSSGRDFSYKYTVQYTQTVHCTVYNLYFPLDTALTGIQRSQLLIDETVSGKNNEYYRVDHSVS